MKITYYKKASIMVGLFITAITVISATATEIPKAGEVLKQSKPKTQTFKLPSQEGAKLASPRLLDEKPGGMKVSLKKILFQGNTVYSDDALMLVLGDLSQSKLDLGGLRGLANKISDHYRANGYAFARAFLPAQGLSSGVLSISIAEGYYGNVSVEGDDSEALSGFARELKTGTLIDSRLLEKKILIMQDIPGIKVRPVMRPGQAVGSGDFNIWVTKEHQPEAFVSIDNYGSRYTGANRVIGYFSDNNLLSTGDQFQANLLLSNEDLVFGSVAYDRLVGYQGLRVGGSFVKTDYQIAEVDESLRGIDTKGIAEVFSLTSSYPLIRSQDTNLNLTFQMDYKQFVDKNLGIETSKYAYTLPIGLNFNQQDAYLGGGITFASIQATFGNLTIETEAAKAQDFITARTDGNFSKINFNVTRFQNLLAQLRLFVNISGQLAGNNLDSAEDMSIGGAQAVRAFPSGEGAADKAILGQVELRYSLSYLAPFIFYDMASAWKNEKPWDSSENKRTLSGGGLGLRADYKQWRGELVAAWRLSGGHPLSDTKEKSPRIWANMSYKF